MRTFRDWHMMKVLTTGLIGLGCLFTLQNANLWNFQRDAGTGTRLLRRLWFRLHDKYVISLLIHDSVKAQSS